MPFDRAKVPGYNIHPVGRPIQFMVTRDIKMGPMKGSPRACGTFPTMEEAQNFAYKHADGEARRVWRPKEETK